MEWVSRRDCHELCKWWSRNENDILNVPSDVPINADEQVIPDDALIMKRPPNGTFWAKELTSEVYDNGTIGDSFMFDRSTVTIRTPDNVIGLKNNCIVEYQGEKWFVVSVQRKNIRNGMTEFAPENSVPHFFYIQLRR